MTAAGESGRVVPEARGWVVRLGAYLRIFGKPAPGTFGYRTSGEYGPPGGQDTYLDSLVRMAQKRDAEFGGDE